MKKRVLVYPCGTEIALEIYRAVCHSKHYELFGGTDGYDHGRFVFRNLIDGLPFISDSSDEKDVREFENAIRDYGIDFIYPAMDGVIAVFAKHRDIFKETLIIAETETAEICRSKKATYERLDGVIEIPKVYHTLQEAAKAAYPLFVKPDKGQGSVGAKKITGEDELKHVDFEKNVVMEYLPGKEYTIDCFTNSDGELVYAKGRGRKRIKNGISVNAIFEDKPVFGEIAERINDVIKQKGGWFFQLREAKDGKLKLLEVATRIAGTSAISRNIGANLPLMTLDVYRGVPINDVSINDYKIELDRALGNVYKTDLNYSTVYVDYDDTVVQDGKVNTSMIKFIYQCVNGGKKIILLSKHEGDLDVELNKYRLTGLFDEVIHIGSEDQKRCHIQNKDSIFIDDSYGERRDVKSSLGIPVFDTHMIECLLED